jgi:hypothetical protein
MDRLTRIAALFIPLAAALLAAPVAAQPGPAAVSETDQEAKLRAIGARGRLLFDLDRAAWVATDDLMKKLRDPAAAGLKGYVVEHDGPGFAVTFFGGEPGRLVAFYVARVAGGKVRSGRLLAEAERVPLTPYQLRLASARAAAVPGDLRPCTQATFNAAVIPPASDSAPIELYLTSAQTQEGVYPAGGHYLLTIGTDNKVQSVRKFTNACLNMPVPRGRKGGPQTAGLFVSHILDPLPTEIHVFLSIWIGKPVFVGIGNPPQVWAVEGDRIRPVSGPGERP